MVSDYFKEKVREVTNSKEDIVFMDNVLEFHDCFRGLHYMDSATIHIIAYLSEALTNTIEYRYDTGEEVAHRIFKLPSELLGSAETDKAFENIFVDLFKLEPMKDLFEEKNRSEVFSVGRFIHNISNGHFEDYNVTNIQKAATTLEELVENLESQIVEESHLLDRIGVSMLRAYLTTPSDYDRIENLLFQVLLDTKTPFQDNCERFSKSLRQSDNSFSGSFDMAVQTYFNNSALFHNIVAKYYETMKK